MLFDQIVFRLQPPSLSLSPDHSSHESSPDSGPNPSCISSKPLIRYFFSAMLKKPREGKGIPTFAMKKLGPPPNTPPQPKRPHTHRQHQHQHQQESGVFSEFIICFQTDPYPLANPHSRLFTRLSVLIHLLHHLDCQQYLAVISLYLYLYISFDVKVKVVVLFP